MANTPVEGNRYIITGVGLDAAGQQRFVSVDREDFSGKPPYQALVAEFIEPPIHIKYRPLSVQHQRIGIYEIGDCQDKPYMMRIDYSEQLRRGDAYVRVDDASIKIGRRMLLRMFNERSGSPVQEDMIEIGFAGDIIHKKLCLPTVDLCRLPSTVERSKLGELVDARKKSRNTGATTRMVRMIHMRLFGSDSPYEDRSPTALNEEIEHVNENYESDDQYFLFEENAERLQLVVFNSGDEPLQNASLTLRMPNHDALHVATCVPARPGGAQQADGATVDLTDYPTVSVRGNEVQVSSTLGEIPVGGPVDVFELPLRICVGRELDGKQMNIRYKLFGSNLRQPVEGCLALSFRSAVEN